MAAGRLVQVAPLAQIAGQAWLAGEEVRISGKVGGKLRAAGREITIGGAIGLALIAGAILVGVIVVLLFPTLTLAAARATVASPWKSLGLGFALLVSTPIAMGIIASTLVGVPLTFVLLDVYLMAVVFAFFVAALAVGRAAARLARKSGDATTRWGRIAVLAVGVVAFVPVLGALALAAALSLGLGALTLELWRICIPFRAS